MNKIKVIKSEQDYKDALNFAKSLISIDPEPESTEGEQLNLLTTLIQDYESKMFPSDLPDPITAIKFAMEQADLKPIDLVPYIGSISRVSEILSGKRNLTVEMIRSLESGLGIPAKVLIQKSGTTTLSSYENWDESLVKDMSKRGYFSETYTKKMNPAVLLEKFFSSIGNLEQLPALLRKSNYRASPLTNKNALQAWFGCVIKKARNVKVEKKYIHGILTYDFMREIAKISSQEKSPVLVQEFLRKHGIILVIEPHFPKTYLDGGAIFIDKDTPIIGLTLRHNRLDNFWFTLMHELAHIALHYNDGISVFYDEIEGVKIPNLDKKEKEADELAGEVLVPSNRWEVSPARIIPSFMAAKSLAQELGVHIAVVAGKIRHEGGKYIYLNKIINETDVKKLFSNEK
jgi:HTH-type transcriptional regulator/antitoxin HigA